MAVCEKNFWAFMRRPKNIIEYLTMYNVLSSYLLSSYLLKVINSLKILACAENFDIY